MGRKFSIMTTINFDKLDREIEEYVSLNCSFNPYIFMSEDTMKAIVKEVKNEFDLDVTDINSNIKPSNGIKAEYCGYKVFINNDLKLGIVEIR
jgi:hypothetical protein